CGPAAIVSPAPHNSHCPGHLNVNPVLSLCGGAQQNRPMQFGGSLRETTDYDPSERAWRFPKRAFGRHDGDRRRLRRRKSVDARRDGRKGDTLELARGLDRAAIAGSQQVRLAVRSPAPNRPDGMDDKTRGQLETRRPAHFAGWTSANRAAG